MDQSQSKDDPILFVSNPKRPSCEILGRYRVIANEYSRRMLFIVFTPLMIYGCVLLMSRYFQGDAALFLMGTTSMFSSFGYIHSTYAPITVPVFILLWILVLVNECSEWLQCLNRTKYGPDKQLFKKAKHLVRAGYRYPARIEAHKEYIEVEDTFEKILPPADKFIKRKAATDKYWMRLRYDEVVCAWYAPDYIVLRFCWGEELRDVWDVIIDRSTFTKGDAEGFIEFAEPHYRFKKTSRWQVWSKARWSSPYASPNLFFPQCFTKIWKVRLPRPKKDKVTAQSKTDEKKQVSTDAD